MKKLKLLLLAILCVALIMQTPLYADEKEEIKALYKQIELLRKRVEQLEEKIEKKEKKEEEMRKEIQEVKEVKKTIENIKKRFGTLSIHGEVITYYQAASSSDIEIDRNWNHFSNPDGAGYNADIELSWKPAKKGEIYMRIHAAEGNGADEYLEEAGALFADLNTLNDDNPDDSEIDVLEAYYTQSLFNDTLSITFGKTEPFVVLDANEFANDEHSQFVGKPFVNNPMLDSEDEYGPILIVNYNPSCIKKLKDLTFTAIIQSSSYPRNPEERQKDKWSNFFRHPFVAGQITYSPTIRGMSGNYRLYGWVQTYDHEKIGKKALSGDTDKGWGVGISCDQYITDRIGLFGRFGYQNDEVYEAPVFYSLGAVLRKILWRNDEIGIGFAGLKANNALYEEHHTEWHAEGYYKIYLTDYFAITADLQYVGNPRGNSKNDNIWAGMIRGEFGF